MCATASDIKNQQEETAQQQTAETGFFCFWVFSFFSSVSKPKTKTKRKKTQTPEKTNSRKTNTREELHNQKQQQQ
jgi:hypothetical protein